MRIDTSEPSLISMFEKGQVGLIRTEFMRKDAVIESLNAQVEAIGDIANVVSAENARIKAEMDTFMTTPTSRLLRAERKEVARLKAENERLRSASFVTAVPSEEYEKVKAEVERLRKAGDVMALGIEGDYNYPMPCVQAWNAAKGDGKPTE
jgi:alanyl-tRNA synthetase